MWPEELGGHARISLSLLATLDSAALEMVPWWA
jgi:hypothetical protein